MSSAKTHVLSTSTLVSYSIVDILISTFFFLVAVVEIINGLPKRPQMHSASDGRQCSIGLGSELCDTCLSYGTYLGWQVRLICLIGQSFCICLQLLVLYIT